VRTDDDLQLDTGRLRIARNLRRMGLVALAAFIGLGVAGVFDPRDGEVSAAPGGEVALEATYPQRARSGLEAPLELLVSRPGGFDRPVEISINRDWLALFDLGSIDPEPDSSTGDAERIYWSFEPPPADELDVTVSLTLRPAVRRGERAHVAVVEGEAEIAVVEFDTGVVP
jgi:hypothetical protein